MTSGKWGVGIWSHSPSTQELKAQREEGGNAEQWGGSESPGAVLGWHKEAVLSRLGHESSSV